MWLTQIHSLNASHQGTLIDSWRDHLHSFVGLGSRQKLFQDWSLLELAVQLLISLLLRFCHFCTCLHIQAYTFPYSYMSISRRIHIYAYAYISIHLHPYIHIHICMSVYKCPYPYISIHVHISLYIHIHLPISIHVHIYHSNHVQLIMVELRHVDACAPVHTKNSHKHDHVYVCSHVHMCTYMYLHVCV